MITATLFLTATNVSAFDATFYSTNNIQFYEESGGTTCSYKSFDTTSNVDYRGRPVFSEKQMDQINSNRPFYESSAKRYDIPWQTLAAIHLRESNLSRKSPNSDGPYQIVGESYGLDEMTDTQFQEATDDAADFVKRKIGNKDLSDPENIKLLFFRYNGVADKYIAQAEKLGFTKEEAARGEGSPYVMNKYDEKRDPSVEPTKSNDTWGQIKQDGGDIEYPANVGHYGAFVYYSVLSGIGFCNNDGNVGSSGDPRDATQVQNAFSSYMKANGNLYNGYKLGYNGCTTLAVWYINTYTKLTYGGGNGEAVVRNLISSNKELKSSKEPVAPSIFSVEGGRPGVWGSTGVSPGHVGVVVHVDAEKKEATVVHTGSSAANISDRSWIATYKYPKDGVTFTYVGDHLK